LKTDKFIKDISQRIDNISNNGNGNCNGCSSNNDDEYKIDKYDDQYYLDIGSEPPRFAYYRHIRVEQCTDDCRKKTYACIIDSITQDELDYALKRELRIPPEQRYQQQKANFLFHDLSCYMRRLGEEDYGCTSAGCIPECRFYPEYGRIEDEEVIEEHNKWIESLTQENAIVEPPSESELLRLVKIHSFD
jgi:hypothetical protein